MLCGIQDTNNHADKINKQTKAGSHTDSILIKRWRFIVRSRSETCLFSFIPVRLEGFFTSFVLTCLFSCDLPSLIMFNYIF